MAIDPIEIVLFLSNSMTTPTMLAPMIKIVSLAGKPGVLLQRIGMGYTLKDHGELVAPIATLNQKEMEALLLVHHQNLVREV